MCYVILDLATGEYLTDCDDTPKIFTSKASAINCIKNDAVRNTREIDLSTMEEKYSIQIWVYRMSN